MPGICSAVLRLTAGMRLCLTCARPSVVRNTVRSSCYAWPVSPPGRTHVLSDRRVLRLASMLTRQLTFLRNPLAIARKVSHGSQSVKGRETRSVLMSLLHTLNALCIDPAARLKVALDGYAQDPETDVYADIFGGLLLHAPMK